MKPSSIAGALVAALLTTPASAADWRMVPDRSHLEFVARYSGNELPGEFRVFDVALRFDAAAPADGRLSVTVDVASADMGDDDLNEAVVGPVWFDAGNFASARFDSEDIVAREPDGFAARGELVLKGARLPVTVPFTWRLDGETAAMRGMVILRRLDFGIGTGSWESTDEVANEVCVRFDVVLVGAD